MCRRDGAKAAIRLASTLKTSWLLLCRAYCPIKHHGNLSPHFEPLFPKEIWRNVSRHARGVAYILDVMVQCAMLGRRVD